MSTLLSPSSAQAAIALRAQDSSQISAAQQLVTKALWLHRDAEKEDLVMRAKIWHSVGECSFALGFLAEGGRYTDASCMPATSAEAIALYKKALKCFKDGLPDTSTIMCCLLFGFWIRRERVCDAFPEDGGATESIDWAGGSICCMGAAEVEAAGGQAMWCHLTWREAKSYLLDSLEALAEQQSGWGDGDAQAPALTSSVHAVDRILEAHRCSDDRAGLVRYFPGIQRLCANVAGRLQPSKDQRHAVLYEKLLSSSSLVCTASGTEEGALLGRQLLQKFLWSNPSTEQAKLCSQMAALRDGKLSEDAGAEQLRALMQMVRKGEKTFLEPGSRYGRCAGEKCFTVMSD
eukprot:s785_g11.t1